mmetsp:Transcript_51876/g.161429  ORF Transcript_51876/g.161429 Transcript_51876/m.161429 type:complete len:93 (+) Transcript_51876:1052-1330(+)
MLSRRCLRIPRVLRQRSSLSLKFVNFFVIQSNERRNEKLTRDASLDWITFTEKTHSTYLSHHQYTMYTKRQETSLLGLRPKFEDVGNYAWRL